MGTARSATRSRPRFMGTLRELMPARKPERFYVTLGSRMKSAKPADSGAVWKALGDPTRRRILDLLIAGPATTGTLCASFELSRFAIMKHLTVLEEAGLVSVERRGRERWNHLERGSLMRILERWLGPSRLPTAPSPAPPRRRPDRRPPMVGSELNMEED